MNRITKKEDYLQILQENLKSSVIKLALGTVGWSNRTIISNTSCADTGPCQEAITFSWTKLILSGGVVKNSARWLAEACAWSSEAPKWGENGTWKVNQLSLCSWLTFPQNLVQVVHRFAIVPHISMTPLSALAWTHTPSHTFYHLIKFQPDCVDQQTDQMSNLLSYWLWLE